MNDVDMRKTKFLATVPISAWVASSYSNALVDKIASYSTLPINHDTSMMSTMEHTIFNPPHLIAYVAVTAATAYTLSKLWNVISNQVADRQPAYRKG